MSKLLDRSDLVGRCFFPTKSAAPLDARDRVLDVPGARLHLRVHGSRSRVLVLLSHGNGETVGAWDGFAPKLASWGARLAVWDYRGYGASTGSPTLRTLFSDAHAVLDHVLAHELAEGERLVVFGRSLGSAAAWDLAVGARSEQLDAVVIDSGFASVDAFVARRGLTRDALDDEDVEALDPTPKARRVRVKALLLHGAADRAIACAEAESLAAVLPRGELVRIEGKGHDDLWSSPTYDDAWRRFLGAP